MQNSFLFFNIISFDFYTLRPTLFQFFDPLEKIESFKAFKIRIHSGDNLLIRPKSHSPEPDLEVKRLKEVRKSQIRRIGWMRGKFEPQFMHFCH